MTIQEAITGIDERTPNGFPLTWKLRWLSELDGILYREVLLTHAGEVPTFSGYPEDLSQEAREETVLLVPAPYDRLYLYYLESRVDYENGETGRYNNSGAMFRAACDDFRNWYTRTHLPISGAARYY